MAAIVDRTAVCKQYSKYNPFPLQFIYLTYFFRSQYIDFNTTLSIVYHLALSIHLPARLALVSIWHASPPYFFVCLLLLHLIYHSAFIGSRTDPMSMYNLSPSLHGPQLFPQHH